MRVGFGWGIDWNMFEFELEFEVAPYFEKSLLKKETLPHIPPRNFQRKFFFFLEGGEQSSDSFLAFKGPFFNLIAS